MRLSDVYKIPLLIIKKYKRINNGIKYSNLTLLLVKLCISEKDKKLRTMTNRKIPLFPIKNNPINNKNNINEVAVLFKNSL